MSSRSLAAATTLPATLPVPAAEAPAMPSTQQLRIAVLPGDGIGIEVMAEAVRVLRAVEAAGSGLRLELSELPAGAGEYQRRGDPLPAETLAACRASDAVLLGAMGWPEIRWPDGREIAPQLDLREQLDLYCGLRPIRLYHAADTPLKGCQAGD
ncbi:MAG TPA: isocitrate/isopropylmalate family dehydrogenase, partial [Pirellulaceae bacterium]|nr:isocitrate/isopropylmalate family dehydrogenase [Pirellulaceae bacterium]